MAAESKPGRVYGGRTSADREAERRQSLLDAAIDTLIAGDKLTVRGICQKTGLTSRYFYENFASTDALAEAAYDTCVSSIAMQVAAAFAAPPTVAEQVEGAMNALVGVLEEDPRAGQILFSTRIGNALISRKRQESTQFFVDITATTADESDAQPVSGVDLGHAAQFVVGGVTQLLSTWLNARYDAAAAADQSEPALADPAEPTAAEPADPAHSAAAGPGPGAAGGAGEEPQNDDDDDTATRPAPSLDGPTVARTAAMLITTLATQLSVDLGGEI